MQLSAQLHRSFASLRMTGWMYVINLRETILAQIFKCARLKMSGIAGFGVLLPLLAIPAFATLGEDAASIQADQVQMKASARILPAQLYSVHEMQTTTGTTIREFVSPAGSVFAVTWQGPFAPDLRQLLGQHFEIYNQAARDPAGRRGRGLHIESGDLVFDSGGHMRFITGRAYLQSKLPSGVRADDVQ